MKVSLAFQADEELFEGSRFYLRPANAALSEAFLLEFDRSLALLRLHPELGAVLRGSIRSLALRRFPYTIVYRVLEAEVRILAIAHQRRRPGFWSTRK